MLVFIENEWELVKLYDKLINNLFLTNGDALFVPQMNMELFNWLQIIMKTNTDGCC